MRVVFVASLEHSGSTLLDLVLGGHPGCVGLGELNSLLDPTTGNLGRRAGIPCSCGTTLEGCPFWGPLCETLTALGTADPAVRYEALERGFRRQFGAERTLVDSSKTLAALRAWIGRPETELRVIHLIRDVRSWTISMADLGRRIGDRSVAELLRRHGWRMPRKWLGRTAWNRFRQWHGRNRAIETTLARLQLKAMRLGYEELALRPRTAVEAVCRFLDLEPVEAMLCPAESASHVALGNRMIGQPDKRRAVLYDDRWLRRGGWLAAALLHPRVMRYNAARVYGNLEPGVWGG